LIAKYGKLWGKIATAFVDRSATACRCRFESFEKTHQESLLADFVAHGVHGEAHEAHNKNVPTRFWSRDEEERLFGVAVKVRHGRTQWKDIAEELFPGRSPAAVRNRWIRFVDRPKSIQIAKNRCRKCGQLRLGHICRENR
jgi:hypothetical protein